MAISRVLLLHLCQPRCFNHRFIATKCNKPQYIVKEFTFCSWPRRRRSGKSQDSAYETLDPSSKSLTGGGCDVVLHFSQHLGSLDRMAKESRQEGCTVFVS